MSEYDWIIAIAFPIMFAIAFFMIDEKNSGLVIFAFLNIGLGIMIYAGLAEIWQLVMCMIFTIFLIYLAKRGNTTI